MDKLETWKQKVVYVAAYAVGVSGGVFAWWDFCRAGAVREEQLWALGVAGVMFLSPIVRIVKWGDLEAHLEEAQRAAREARVYYSVLGAVTMPALGPYYRVGTTDLTEVGKWLLQCARRQGALFEDLCEATYEKPLKGPEQPEDKEHNRDFCREVIGFLKAEKVLEDHPPRNGQTAYRVPDDMQEAVKRAFAHYG